MSHECYFFLQTNIYTLVFIYTGAGLDVSQMYVTVPNGCVFIIAAVHYFIFSRDNYEFQFI